MEMTLTIIKPDRIEKAGEILELIKNAGFKLIAVKTVKLTPAMAEDFYGIHKGKPFFNELVKFMCSGTIAVAILEKENAVEDFRKLIGTTNPDKAEEGTIRKKYGESVSCNAIHGSDSVENAITEGYFFFSKMERYNR